MSGRIVAVNHDRKQWMPVGHSLWYTEGVNIDSPLEEQMKCFEPRDQRVISKFQQFANELGPQQLMIEAEVKKLGYEKLLGFWETLPLILGDFK